MPVTTRSQRRLMFKDEQVARTTESPKKLVDITNTKQIKLTSKLQKENFLQEMNVSKQITVELPPGVAKKKRKAAQSIESRQEAIEVAKKSRTENPPQIQSSGSECLTRSSIEEHTQFVEMMRRIKRMHEESFKNVAERLQLDPVPSCLYDLKQCHSTHHTKNIIKLISNTTKTTILDALSIDARIWRFIHGVIHNVLGLNMFPGSDVLYKILEKILKLSRNNEFNVNFVLGELHSLFADIVNKFPPCHIRAHYLKVFKTNFNVEGIKERKHLLPTILDQISELIFERNSNAEQPRKYNDDIAYNFEVWDQYQQNETFANFSTNDRFERLFLVLDLAVRVLEHDASIFIIKYSYKFASSISNDRLKPLICSVIWQDYENESVIVINTIIRQLIKIFVAMIALQYPPDKIKILSRLLSLVGHVINMYEYPNDTFQYPIYQNYSIDFAREIQRCIENSTYFSMHLHQRVVDSIRSPLVRMLLMNFMMTKVTGKTRSVSLSIPFNAILKNDMDNYVQQPRTVLEKSKERYPKYEEIKKETKFTVVQSDYLQMLLSYTEAIDSYYGISNAAASYFSSADSIPSQAVKQECFDMNDLDVLLTSEITLRKVDLNFKKMVHIRFTKESCAFYRDEIKNLLILNKHIPLWKVKFDTKFDAWFEFVQKTETKIAGNKL